MQIKGFEILSEEGDIKIKVFGETLDLMFLNALHALSEFLKPDFFQLKQKKSEEKEEIKIEAVDISSLLVEFLSGVLARSDMKNMLFLHARFDKFGENFLEGIISGVHVDVFARVINSISYDVEVTKNQVSGLYEAVLVFEI